MDEESNQRRMMLAAAVCMGLLLVWPYIFPPKTPQAAGDGTQTSTAAVAEAAPATQTATAALPVEAGPVEATPTVPPELSRFSGAVAFENREVPYELAFTNIGGGVDAFTLPTYFERAQDDAESKQPITLADPTAGMQNVQEANFLQTAALSFVPAETSFSLPARIGYEVQREGDKLTYRYKSAAGVVVERQYEVKPDRTIIEMAVRVRNEGSVPQRMQLKLSSGLKATPAMAQGSGFFARFVPPPDHLQALCYTDESVEREDYKSLNQPGEPPKTFTENVRWVAIDRQYFISALVLRDETKASCVLSGEGNAAQAALLLEPLSLKPGEEHRYRLASYMGMKSAEALTRVESNLEDAIDYRFIGFDLAWLCGILLWILRTVHGLIGSWGIAIILLTVLVKAVLFPVNQRAMRSMRAMSALKPEMDELREKYADNKQRQQEEMMALYRKHGVNPAGGCLPMLMQMPIFVALYRSLWSSVDLYQEGFLWIPDLTASDPLWILPIALFVAMFLQQRFTPTTMESSQQKMMQWTMPILFGAMMAALPAGLCLYILSNTLLTIVQQHLINKSIPVAPAQEAKA